MNIRERIPLKNYTTFKTGGPARFFTCVRTMEELQDAVQFANEKAVPIFVLGGGSNVVIRDKGFPGLVIKIEIVGKEENGDEIIVGAGEEWDSFVAYAVKNGRYGIENLSYIPGTVGAAPVQNIGAYGVEVQSAISWVEAVDSETGKIQKFSHGECLFGYRDSFFKKPEGKKYIITRVAFHLSKTGTLTTTYKDISTYIADHKLQSGDLTLQIMRDMVIDIRKKKLPDVWQENALGTAGSFFKNPVVSKEFYENLQHMYADIPGFSVDAHSIKIPAAWLLDKLCNFKGYREGNVGVYNNQALVIVNFSDAHAEDIISLAEKMIACVKEKTDIILEKEVQII